MKAFVSIAQNERPQFSLKLKYRSIFLRLANAHVHAAFADFVFRRLSAVESVSGQHPKCLHILLHSSECSAVRFLFWWLFLHHRLRSRQRGSSRLAPVSGIALFGCSFPKSVVCFYPNNSKSLATFLSKPFGFGSRRL